MKDYALKIKIGEYTQDGQKKGRYKDIGQLRSNERGPYLLLDTAMLSPSLLATIGDVSGQDRIAVSMYEME